MENKSAQRSQVVLWLCLTLGSVLALMNMSAYRATVAASWSRHAQPQADSTPTPTQTPTSHPGVPTLIAPANGALLPQPVPPFQWTFTWIARTGPCRGCIWILGPDDRFIEATVQYKGQGYQYTFTRTELLPDEALSPWIWTVFVDCPLGHNQSETRRFSVMPAAWFTYIHFLPLVLKDS
jgi:hypothetical protein